MVDVHAIIEARKKKAKAQMISSAAYDMQQRYLIQQERLRSEQAARKAQDEQNKGSFMQGVRKKIIERFEQSK